MTRIAIADAELLGDITDQLQQAGHIVTVLPDVHSLNAWLAERGGALLLLSLPPENEMPSRPAAPKRERRRSNADRQLHWRINPTLLELSTPEGKAVPLSHTDCRILQTAARTQGQRVSRKALIEALGENFLHYDERRLETQISRLRRRLSSYAPGGFPIRAIRGQGYLFGVKLLEVGSGNESAGSSDK